MSSIFKFDETGHVILASWPWRFDVEKRKTCVQALGLKIHDVMIYAVQLLLDFILHSDVFIMLFSATNLAIYCT